jgi:hypothetical protein
MYQIPLLHIAVGSGGCWQAEDGGVVEAVDGGVVEVVDGGVVVGREAGVVDGGGLVVNGGSVGGGVPIGSERQLEKIRG